MNSEQKIRDDLSHLINRWLFLKVKVRMITYLPLYAIIMLNSMCNIFRTTFSKLAVGYFCKYFALQIFFCQIEQNISCIIKCEHCLIILCKQFNRKNKQEN